MPGFLWKCRSFLLVWLLSSGEALSVYGSVSVASSGAGGAGDGRSKGSAVEKSGGSKTGIFGRFSKGVESSVCREGDAPGSCAALAAGYRGGATGEAAHSYMSLNALKILLQLALTGLNVACWLLPLKIRRFVESKSAIGMANAFSGGVFLSLAFGHMIPHAHHGFEGSGLPDNLPYMLTLSGYMLIFFVEKMAFDTHHVLADGDAAHGHPHEATPALPPPTAATVVAAAGGDSSKSKKAVVDAAAAALGNNGASSSAAGTSGRSAIILLLALSVHALMETMAMGLSSTSLNASLLAMSIGLHQPAESLALLVSFLKSGLSEQQVIKYLSIFSLVGPLGLLLGLAISEFAGQKTDAMLVAVAAGTFIYVGATEVISEEFETPENKWPKFLSLISGIVIVGFIISWAEALEGKAT